jgi:hypothetical protein
MKIKDETFKKSISTIFSEKNGEVTLSKENISSISFYIDHDKKKMVTIAESKALDIDGVTQKFSRYHSFEIDSKDAHEFLREYI